MNNWRGVDRHLILRICISDHEQLKRRGSTSYIRHLHIRHIRRTIEAWYGVIIFGDLIRVGSFYSEYKKGAMPTFFCAWSTFLPQIARPLLRNDKDNPLSKQSKLLVRIFPNKCTWLTITGMHGLFLRGWSTPLSDSPLSCKRDETSPTSYRRFGICLAFSLSTR